MDHHAPRLIAAREHKSASLPGALDQGILSQKRFDANSFLPCELAFHRAVADAGERPVTAQACSVDPKGFDQEINPLGPGKTANIQKLFGVLSALLFL